MRSLKRLFTFFLNLGDRLLCVLFAVLLTQVPTYLSQYQDSLATVRLRSEKTYLELDAKAAQFNLDVNSFLEQQRLIPDSMRLTNPQLMQDAVARYYSYNEAYRAISESPEWKKPFALAKHYDPSIHASFDFEPKIDYSWTSAIYALMGVLIALGVLGLLYGLFSWINRRFNKARPVYDPYKYRRKDLS
ncbi:MAG: DUF2937 family protein [Bacteroidota bacterium]